MVSGVSCGLWGWEWWDWGGQWGRLGAMGLVLVGLGEPMGLVGCYEGYGVRTGGTEMISGVG